MIYSYHKNTLSVASNRLQHCFSNWGSVWNAVWEWVRVITVLDKEWKAKATTYSLTYLTRLRNAKNAPFSPFNFDLNVVSSFTNQVFAAIMVQFKYFGIVNLHNVITIF